jgi:hypothetical protein
MYVRRIAELPLRWFGFWGDQINQDDPHISWLWQGFLAAANVTLLTSQWKSGKTTLISILLSRLREPGSLAGVPIGPLKTGRAVIVSEETRAQWRIRHQKLDLRHVYFICQPFKGKPSLNEWLAWPVGFNVPLTRG